MIRRLLLALGSFVLVAAPVFAQIQNPDDGFKPLSSVPPGQELPAAPFVLTSYAFFLLLMMFYLWTIWRRINRVEREMKELEKRQAGSTR